MLAGIRTPGYLLLRSRRPGKASTAQSDCKAIDTVARQIADQWKDGYNSGNAKHQVAALYTEDAYYLTQHFVTGIIHGQANIRAYIQRGVDAKYHVDSMRFSLPTALRTWRTRSTVMNRLIVGKGRSE